MENSVKRKINIFGKVMKIITTVVIVFLLVAEGFMLTGGVIVAAVPKDSITVKARVNADANLNMRYFGIEDYEPGQNRFFFDVGGNRIAIGEFGNGEIQVSNEDGTLNLNADVRNLHFDLNDALLLIVYGMVSLASVIVALFFFKALMKEFMICDSPFCDGVVRKMRNFAIALIPCVVVAEGMKKAIAAIISNTITLDFNLVSAGFVIVIFVLTMIFKYGAELQKEHDETV